MMKKQSKQNKNSIKGRNEERDYIKEISNINNMQPVPQPKDYEEIEY